jgi:hypothetical protein
VSGTLSLLHHTRAGGVYDLAEESPALAYARETRDAAVATASAAAATLRAAESTRSAVHFLAWLAAIVVALSVVGGAIVLYNANQASTCQSQGDC